jgi:sporulation protein YlmC with PRC-barrel domain
METAERDVTETTGTPDPAPLTDPSGETPAPAAPIALTIEVSSEQIEPTVTYQSVTEWHGKELVDRDGETIGKLERVYFDVETEEPQFATVKEGFIGRHLTFVPLTGAIIGPDSIQVAVSRNQVKDAPTIQQDGDGLSPADESALYHHFELNYTPTDTTTGQRLALR